MSIWVIQDFIRDSLTHWQFLSQAQRSALAWLLAPWTASWWCWTLSWRRSRRSLNWWSHSPKASTPKCPRIGTSRYIPELHKFVTFWSIWYLFYNIKNIFICSYSITFLFYNFFDHYMSNYKVTSNVLFHLVNFLFVYFKCLHSNTN